MDNSPINDDTLSAIIDGEADDESVASVARNPKANARLAQLRAVSKLVASPVADATPERRAASIAAAMKAADSSTGVSSLAVRREAKRQAIRPQWFAAAAAILLVLVALPLLARLSESDADLVSSADAGSAVDDVASTTTTPAFATSRQSLSANRDGAEGDTDDAMDDEAMSDELVDAEQAASAPDTAAAVTEGTEAPPGDIADADGAAQFDLLSSSYAEFNALLREGELEPVYSIDDPIIVANVSVACLEEFADIDGAAFSLAQVQIDGSTRILLLHFTDDGVIDTLDASDCTPIG